MSHNFDYESAERSSLVERCKAFEALHSAEHALCMSTFKELDTYRELCGELVAELREARLFFDYDFLRDLYQEKSLMGGINRIAAAITKAESILGGNNGTSN